MATIATIAQEQETKKAPLILTPQAITKVREIMATQDGEALMIAALAECQAVAAASGFSPRPESRERVQAMLTERGSINSPSMRQDLEAGRRTEAEWVVGDMLKRARGLGLVTPLLSAAYCHLQVHENRLASRR